MTQDKNSIVRAIDDCYSRLQSNNKHFEMSETETSILNQVIEQLNTGHLRVASKVSPAGEWQIHEWVKKSILLYFRTHQSKLIEIGDINYFDKIPIKKWTGHEGVRVVPHAIARIGSHVAAGAILMPSYINIGAFVDSGTMVDTWATVGSCAQIGKNVHLSGGVGIGGVLEPLQGRPVIIEDNAFIGSRSIIVEGVIVEEGAVIGAGVTLTASTKIIDVTGTSPEYFKARVPKNSVVIPGTLPREFRAGTFNVPCALIIGHRKESTDQKTSLNDVLRDFQVAV